MFCFFLGFFQQRPKSKMLVCNIFWILLSRNYWKIQADDLFMWKWLFFGVGGMNSLIIWNMLYKIWLMKVTQLYLHYFSNCFYNENTVNMSIWVRLLKEIWSFDPFEIPRKRFMGYIKFLILKLLSKNVVSFRCLLYVGVCVHFSLNQFMKKINFCIVQIFTACNRTSLTIFSVCFNKSNKKVYRN